MCFHGKAHVAQRERDTSTIAQMGEICPCAPTYKNETCLLSQVCLKAFLSFLCFLAKMLDARADVAIMYARE